MAAPARTLSGSRFLRPKLSRFFNQVARACPQVSRFLAAAVAALPPPLPGIFASRFVGREKAAPPPAAAPRAPPVAASRFLQPKRKAISRFFNQAAKVKRRISRFMTGETSLAPRMPDIFSSRFLTKPRRPPKSPLRGHWPRKPSGPKR